jgi:UDPglucose 6-dehydrogenase
MKNVRELVGDKINFTENQYDALNNCDALIIATEWSEFRTPDFEKMNERMKNKVIFDGRNVFDLEQMQELGYYYESIGRKTIGS